MSTNANAQEGGFVPAVWTTPFSDVQSQWYLHKRPQCFAVEMHEVDPAGVFPCGFCGRLDDQWAALYYKA